MSTDLFGNPTVQYDKNYRVIPQKPPEIQWIMPKGEKAGPPSGEPEVYVLMRFKSDVKERVRTACYLEKKVIENYGGRVVGISDGVALYEGNCWDVNMSVLLLHFPSKTRAEQWLFSDRKFRDKEWPLPASSLEIVIMPLLYKPPKTALTFQLIELRDFMDEKFQNQYVEKVAPIMDKFRIKHGVVASYDITGNRNSWIGPKTYCLLNAYESETNLDAFYYSDEYGPHKGYRQSVCRTDNVVFTLDPCLKAPKS